jgi:hypothetical protein
VDDDKSIFQKIGDAVANYAPGLAGVLAATGVGAPAAAAVGAVGALARAFGLGKEASPDDVFRAVTTDPEIALKAKIADQEFELRKREQDIEEIKAILADVQSARMRQVGSEQATGKRDTNLYVLSWVTLMGFFTLIVFLLWTPIPTDQSGVIFMLFGTLAAAVTQIFNYFYGSSKSSSDKTAIMARKV